MAHQDPLPSRNVGRAIGAVRSGLPVTRLDKLARTLDVDRNTLLKLLGISSRTVQRKLLLSKHLSPTASDRLSRIDRVYAFAADVLGDSEIAAGWLKRPSRALANQPPLHLLDTDAGSQKVEQELRQIEYGFVY